MLSERLANIFRKKEESIDSHLKTTHRLVCVDDVLYFQIYLNPEYSFLVEARVVEQAIGRTRDKPSSPSIYHEEDTKPASVIPITVIPKYYTGFPVFDEDQDDPENRVIWIEDAVPNVVK